MENLVGAPTGIEPASPAIRADMLTTTPQHPGTNYAKFACSNHPWRKAGSAMAVYSLASLVRCTMVYRNLISTMFETHSMGWHIATTYGVNLSSPSI